MKNFKITKVLMIVVLILGGIYLICPEYLRNALFYQSPDVDDHKIFDNRTVIAGAYYPWDKAQGFNKRDIPLVYNNLIKESGTAAFLVAQHNKIVFEKYWDGYSSETRSNSFEMANSIISLLVGIAINQGSIKSVDQPVGDFIPQFSHNRKAKVTIRHLLEMKSGLSWEDAYGNPLSTTSKAYYGKDLALLALKQEVISEPGQNFELMNGNTQLLALVLENATGISVSAFCSQKLWKPIGASQDAFWSLDEVNGTEKAFCCFSSNARDFARLGQLILNQGSWNGKQIVSKDYLNNALQAVSQWNGPENKSGVFYGWNWWVGEYKGMDVYYMKGYKGQYMIVIPDKDLLIVRLGRKSISKKKNDNSREDLVNWLDLGLEIAD